MVNAWSLAASILNGTFDEDYPMKEEIQMHGMIINVMIPMLRIHLLIHQDSSSKAERVVGTW